MHPQVDLTPRSPNPDIESVLPDDERDDSDQPDGAVWHKTADEILDSLADYCLRNF